MTNIRVIGPLQPIDLQRPETLERRATQAAVASAHFGTTIAPLKASEVEDFVEQLREAPADQAASVLQRLYRGLGRDAARALVPEIVERRGDGIALYVVGDEARLARDIIRGGRLLRETPELASRLQDRRAAMAGYLGAGTPGGLTADQAAALAPIREAATALYATRRDAAPGTDFDEDLFKAALSDVVDAVVAASDGPPPAPLPGLKPRAFDRALTALHDLGFGGANAAAGIDMRAELSGPGDGFGAPDATPPAGQSPPLSPAADGTFGANLVGEEGADALIGDGSESDTLAVGDAPGSAPTTPSIPRLAPEAIRNAATLGDAEGGLDNPIELPNDKIRLDWGVAYRLRSGEVGVRFRDGFLVPQPDGAAPRFVAYADAWKASAQATDNSSKSAPAEPPANAGNNPDALRSFPPAPAADKRKQELDLFRGVINTVAQGVTFGYSDEINAGLAAVFVMGAQKILGGDAEFQEVFERALQNNRAHIEAFAKEHQGVARALEVAGMALGPGTVFKLGMAPAANTSRILQMTHGATLGGLLGRLYDMGQGDGTFSERLKASDDGARWGAALGAIGGPAVGPVLRQFGRIIGLDGGLKKAATRIFDELVRQSSAARAVRRLNRLDPNARLDNAKSASFEQMQAVFLLARAGEAESTYKAAFEKGVPATEELRVLLNSEAAKTAWAQVRQRAKAAEVELSDLYHEDAADMILPKQVGILDARAIDLLQRRMDELAADSRSSATDNAAGDIARSMGPARRRLLTIVDKLNPHYAKARAIFAGDHQSKRALEMGRHLLRAGDRVNAQSLAKLSPGDKAFFRLGAEQALREAVMETPGKGNIVRGVLADQRVRETLAAAFSSRDKYRAFLRQMQEEETLIWAENRHRTAR